MSQLTKIEIRKKLQARRRLVSQEDRWTAGQAIAKSLGPLVGSGCVDSCFLFFPLGSEIRTEPSFELCQRHKIPCYFPKVVGEDLEFFRVEELSSLIKGTYAKEPSGGDSRTPQKRSLILVPGIAFHPLGYRVGYGKAFYDRYLSQNPQGLRVGVGYDFQVVLDGWNWDEWDQLVALTLTPKARWGSTGLLDYNLF